MHMLKRLIIAGLMVVAPVAAGATAAIPAAPATAAAASTAAVTPATSTGATVDTSAGAPANPAWVENGFAYARPEADAGQPVAGGYDFQPQVTATGEQAHWLNNAILLPLMAAISVFVLILMFWIMARYRRAANPVPSKNTHNTTIEVVWTLVPVLILVFIAVPSIDLIARQYEPAPRDALTIKVTGYQWYWGYEYPDNGISEIVSNMATEEQATARGEPFHLAVDNRMVVPAGRTVKLLITGSDVIHSFAVPALWTKMDAVPGRINEVTFRAERPGVYYGQCSELCGINHGYMPIAVEVVTPERFAQWVASRGGRMGPAPAVAAAATPAVAAPAAAPATPSATPAPAAAPTVAPAN